MIYVREAAKGVGVVLAARHPRLITLERDPKRRGSKVYLDYLQLGRGKTVAGKDGGGGLQSPAAAGRAGGHAGGVGGVGRFGGPGGVQFADGAAAFAPGGGFAGTVTGRTLFRRAWALNYQC